MKKIVKSIINLILFILIVSFSILFLVYNVFYPMQYKEEILKYSKEYEIDPYLVYAIINVESRFNPDVESGAKARGLMQIREITANWAKEHIELEELNEEDYFKPDTNIKIGCWYLSKLSDMYSGDIKKIAASYNAGTGNLDKWVKEGKDIENYDIPFPETKEYVRKVEENLEVYKVLYGDDYTKDDLISAISKIVKLITEKAFDKTIELIEDINNK